VKVTHYDDHAERRAAAYPPIGDQLDVLWRFIATLPLTPEVGEMLTQIQAVKARFPKPPDAP
jgi:hypothetical protein